LTAVVVRMGGELAVAAVVVAVVVVVVLAVPQPLLTLMHAAPAQHPAG
jgi:hypothetical protein